MGGHFPAGFGAAHLQLNLGRRAQSWHHRVCNSAQPWHRTQARQTSSCSYFLKQHVTGGLVAVWPLDHFLKQLRSLHVCFSAKSFTINSQHNRQGTSVANPTTLCNMWLFGKGDMPMKKYFLRLQLTQGRQSVHM